MDGKILEIQKKIPIHPKQTMRIILPCSIRNSKTVPLWIRCFCHVVLTNVHVFRCLVLVNVKSVPCFSVIIVILFRIHLMYLTYMANNIQNFNVLNLIRCKHYKITITTARREGKSKILRNTCLSSNWSFVSYPKQSAVYFRTY